MKFLLVYMSFFFVVTTFAQQDSMLPPYQRYPSVPGLQLLTIDSTFYTKGDIPKNKPVMLVIFSPDCDHCQHEAEQIVANKEELANIHIIMASTFPIHRLKEFGEKYGLSAMNNVVLTKDPYYLLISFYAVRSLPFLALYGKKGKLIGTFQGKAAIDQIIATFNQAN